MGKCQWFSCFSFSLFSFRNTVRYAIHCIFHVMFCCEIEKLDLSKSLRIRSIHFHSYHCCSLQMEPLQLICEYTSHLNFYLSELDVDGFCWYKMSFGHFLRDIFIDFAFVSVIIAMFSLLQKCI